MEANLIFPEYIKSECVKKNLSFRKLCEGVINASSIERFFAGELDLDFDKQFRLLSRLGYDPSDYEKYVYKKSFDKLKEREIILSLVREKNVSKLDEALVNYKENHYKQSSIDRQFYFAMELQRNRIKGNAVKNLFAVAIEALVQTVPNYSKHLMDLDYLSLEEINLYIEILISSDVDNLGDIKKELRRLFENIGLRDVSLNFKAKTMPKIAYHYIDLCIKGDIGTTDYWDLLEVCNMAVEILRDANYMFYLYELIKLSENLKDALTLKGVDASNIPISDFDPEIIKSSLDYLAERYHKSVNTDNFNYIYDNFNYYCLGDVVRIRRSMLRLRLSDLSSDEATQRAIGRLERNERKTIKETVRKVLLNLNLCPEFYKLRIVTNENDVIEDYLSCVKLINGKQYGKAYEILNKLEKELDLSIRVNRIEMIWKKLCILRGLGEINSVDYADKLKRLLLEVILELNPECLNNKGHYYFSIQELTIIYNIARYGEPKEKILDFLYNYIRGENSILMSREKLWFLNAIAGMYGDCGKNEKSIELSEVVLESAIDMKAASFIQESLYGIFWNDAAYMHIIDKKSQTMILRECYEISIFCKDEYSISFYKRKLNEQS